VERSNSAIDRNGFGLSITEAEEEVRLIESEFGFLPDNQQIHAVWRGLVTDHGVRGRQVHDARLIAVMRVHGLSHLLTLNRADFIRYGGITVIDPSDFTASK
jgi:predicted nucleic acid-binding protein